MTPACEPVNERASAPRLAIAMASSAMLMRSPEVSSMSSSRGGGTGLICCARSSNSSVVSPMAETTTTTSLPAALGGDDAFGDALDPLRVLHGRAAVLLNDERHGVQSIGGRPRASIR